MSLPDTLPRHPVRLVAARTGLSPHVLRAWERRHRVVEPARTEGGQRLYSDLDITRLRLLHRLTERGHGIGRIAPLSLAELERMAREELPAEAPRELGRGGAQDFQDAVLGAVGRLDAGELHSVLERAVVTVGVPAFLDTVAGPALHAIGEGWRQGTLTVAHEHLATAVFRRVLGWIVATYEVHAAAPRLIVATPSRQLHELGAMLVAAAAAAEGWGVTYLGADLPAADILGAARQVGAGVVALSLVYPADDAELTEELSRIRRELPPGVALLVGGAAAGPARERIEAAGARVVDSLGHLRQLLRGLAAATPEAR
jgi:DNA-binding transcriptional MerR regulator/methylmalonyl-CoA mutase cobalamin-binding subunit